MGTDMQCEWGECSSEVAANVRWEAPPADPSQVRVCAVHASQLERTGTSGLIVWLRPNLADGQVSAAGHLADGQVSADERCPVPERSCSVPGQVPK